MAIYALLSAWIFIDPMFGMFLPTTLCRLMELSVLIAIIVLAYRFLIISKPFYYGKYISVLLFFLLVISIGMIVRGDFSGGVKGIVFAINSKDRTLAYMLPFIVLMLPNIKYFQTILNVMFYSSLLAIPLWLLNAGSLVREMFFGESIGAYFPFFSAFLLGFIPRLSKRQCFLIISVYIIYLFLMILNARRNVILSFALYGSLVVILYFFRKKKDIKIVFLALAGFLLLSIAVFLNLSRLSDGMFSNLLDRGLEDTRSGVEMLFFADIASSPVSDAIVGRGMDGTYFQIVQVEDTMETTTDRGVIETGYLHMMLKGGLVYVLLVVFLIILSVFNGFKSRRRDLCYISCVLIIYLIDLYTTSPVAVFGVRSIIFWFAVSCCLQYRQLRAYIK